MEKEIIKFFKQQFKIRKNIGNEYFEGDWKSMRDVINPTFYFALGSFSFHLFFPINLLLNSFALISLAYAQNPFKADCTLVVLLFFFSVFYRTFNTMLTQGKNNLHFLFL